MNKEMEMNGLIKKVEYRLKNNNRRMSINGKEEDWLNSSQLTEYSEMKLWTERI